MRSCIPHPILAIYVTKLSLHRMSERVFLVVLFMIVVTCICGNEVTDANNDLNRRTSNDTNGDIPAMEIQALQDLYESTAGDYWHWKTNTTEQPWNFSDPNANPCTDRWQGISCASQHIDQLILSGYGLVGALPSSLDQLSRLNTFMLNNNSLIGTLPTSLGNLSQLETFSIASNDLSGTIPEYFGGLSELQVLDLSYTGLAGPMPASFSNLSRLQVLDLSYTDLAGTIPESFGNLSQLQVLDLSYTDLAGTIPDSFGSLSQLLVLDVSYAALTGTIPVSLGNLSRLHVLDLYSNDIAGSLPASLGGLSQLQELSAGTNKLTGYLPASFGRLAQLKVLDVSKNSLRDTIPASLGELPQLQVLDVQQNELTGTIPACVGNLSQLQVLNLYSNDLAGSIPAALGNLSQLQVLSAGANYLIGTIPASLSNLSQLEQISLESNLLTGGIPATFGGLHQLTQLSMSANLLTGTIPPALGNLSQLVHLTVYRNMLKGAIPASLGCLSQLAALDFNANQLTGTIPVSFGSLSQLQVLDVGANQLTGPIPASLGNLASLSYIIIGANRLSGTIPEALSKLHLLMGMSMEGNRLRGTLPDFLGSYSQLQFLQISNNSFSGTIPDSIGNLSALFECSVAYNSLTGSIPRSVARIPLLNAFVVDHNRLSGSLDEVFNATMQTGLETIIVNNNQLTGTIPSAIFELPTLTSAIASINCFHGALPDNICSSRLMKTLVLDGLSAAPACRNKLLPGVSSSYVLKRRVYGAIPSCLFHLPALATLYLSGNALEGQILVNSSAIGAKLVSLSLSHNLLTGTIPEGLQGNAWATLDLSYNRLRGSLSSSLAAKAVDLNASYAGVVASKSTSLFLENNRLSGVIPHSVRNLKNISILDTNLFSCKLDGSDLPQHDSSVSNYQCGSSVFDVPYYVWLGLCAVAAVLVGCAVRFRSSLQGCFDVGGAAKRWVEWSRCVGTCGEPSSPGSVVSESSQYRYVGRFCQILDAIRTHAVIWTVAITVTLLPLYAALSHYYGTHQQAYAWAVSAAYLSGTVPFGLEMVLWLVLLGLAMGSMLSCCRFSSNATAVAHPLATAERTASSTTVVESIATKQQLFLIYVLFMSINLVIVGGVNVAYVYVSIYRSSQLLTFAQICMSFFKVLYNGVASTNILRCISRYVTGRDMNDSCYASLRALSAIVNNIVIPFVVVMIVSPSCFYNAFVAEPSVSAVYSYYRLCIDDIGHCVKNEYQIGYSQYDPPFTYSYQCSSSLITSYAPAFVNLCIVSMFVVPIAHVLAVEALRRADKSTRWFQLLNMAVPTTWKLPAIGETSGVTRTYFNPLREQLVQLNFVALIFTFGVVFPPLAAALAVTLVVCTALTKLRLGRLLQHVCDHDGFTIAQDVERACESLLGSALLRDFVGMLSVVACLFYTLFLFDTLGDTVGFERAYWVLIVVPLLPVCVITVLWVCPRLSAGRPGLDAAESRRGQPTAEMTALPSLVSGSETFNVINQDLEAHE